MAHLYTLLIFHILLLNDHCTLGLNTKISGFHNFSFRILVSKILICDTWYSYTPLQYHVLYTLSGRGVTRNVITCSANKIKKKDLKERAKN